MSEVKAILEQVLAEKASVSSTEPQPSIAVLPFVNMSGDKEQEYFSDGLAEEIINALTQIPGLRVIARTSAFAFKDKREDIRRIAEVLGVTNILEGSVRKAGNRIRATAQLIDASNGSHLWSERYDREMNDVFAIQDDISQAIAKKLRIKFAGSRPLIKRRTENMEAYNLYLMGLYHALKLTPEGIAKCKEYFEQSIAADPDYAPPWSGLAGYYFVQGFRGIMPANEANAQCKQATLKALELDETLPEAHGQLAVLLAAEFDRKGAEREFHRALELGPEVWDVWINYATYYLLPMQQLNEAVRAMQKALELDPLSPASHQLLGYVYWHTRQYDRAIEQFHNALELEPHLAVAHLCLGLTYIQTGKSDEGIRAIETGVQLTGQEPNALGNLGYAYARAGRIGEARRVLERLQQLAQKAYTPAFAFAMVYLGLGEIDKGFDWLEKAVDEREAAVYLINVNPLYDPLRSHPRYHALMRKMNLNP